MIFDVNDSDFDLSSLDGDEISDYEGSDSGSEYDSDLDLDSDDERDIEAALRDDIRWNVGKVIRVKFINGNPTIHKKVKKYASIWMKYANITFKFVSDNEPSDVRISFYKGQGCHSKVGTNALKVPQSKPTMNLGFSSRASEERIRRTVLHEFGHVLGCSHEHSSPNADIPWNPKAVYAYFERTNLWDKAKTDHNVLAVKHESSVASEFDPKSIMIYDIPSEITRGGFSVPWNTQLSEIDKRMIAEQYPKPVRCHRCRRKINSSDDLHCYCETHSNYLCEDCYDSPNTHSQVRDGSCNYVVYNDDDEEFDECNRCHIGVRKSGDDSFYCRNHENYLCGDCYNTSSTRRQVKQGSCSYEEYEESESESDEDEDKAESTSSEEHQDDDDDDDDRYVHSDSDSDSGSDSDSDSD